MARNALDPLYHDVRVNDSRAIGEIHPQEYKFGTAKTIDEIILIHWMIQLSKYWILSRPKFSDREGFVAFIEEIQGLKFHGLADTGKDKLLVQVQKLPLSEGGKNIAYAEIFLVPEKPKKLIASTLFTFYEPETKGYIEHVLRRFEHHFHI